MSFNIITEASLSAFRTELMGDHLKADPDNKENGNMDWIEWPSYLNVLENCEISKHNLDRVNHSLRSFDLLDPRFFKDGSRDMAQTSKALHQAMGHMDRATAANPCIWFTLAHDLGDEDTQINGRAFIKSHLKKGTLTRRMINDRLFYKLDQQSAISKDWLAQLWWSAELTKENNYELTPTMWAHSEIQLQLMDRSFSRNSASRTAFLSFCKENHIKAGARPDGSRINFDDPLKESLRNLSCLIAAYDLPSNSAEVRQHPYFLECQKHLSIALEEG